MPRSTSATTPRSPRRRTAGRSRSTRCGRSSFPSGMCSDRFIEGRTKLSTAAVEGFPAPQRRPGADRYDAARARHVARCAWSRSWSTTTTWSSLAREAPARATCSSRSRRMPTSSRAARRPSPACSSTRRTGSAGLVCQYDVVCFDEVSGVSFDQKDGVNIMKGYMESGEFSRGKESIRADGSIVMVGNFDVDVQHQQRVGHLFGPMPPEMRNDTAFMDRIHGYLPGWDVPKMSRATFHRSLRPGQRLPGRRLDAGCAIASRAAVLQGPCALWRGVVRARPERGQQDRQRPAEAAPSGSGLSRFPTKTWSGQCGWRWNVAAG